jgi:uncharacterized protein (DUF2141 family)
MLWENLKMKTSTLSVFMIMSLSLIRTFAQDTPKDNGATGKLTVIIEGLKNDEGTVQIGLFNSKESWEGKTKKLKGAIIGIKGKKAEWKIEDIPHGEYAIRFFHDEDGDGEMDKNLFGMPTESFGFSNNAKAVFRMPGYEEAKFIFNPDNEIIKIVVD